MIEVELSSSICQLPQLWVRDVGERRMVEDFVKQYLDHRYLNDAIPQSTAEVLAVPARTSLDDLPEFAAVWVSEMPRCGLSAGVSWHDRGGGLPTGHPERSTYSRELPDPLVKPQMTHRTRR